MLPRLVVSSVVRGSRQGDSHGGLYLIDVGAGTFEQVFDWNSCSIDFAGRGGDRGLRGVVVQGDYVYIAASDELFVLNRKFDIVTSYRNRYLKHCHEICAYRDDIFVTSTGFDSVLRFNIAACAFVGGTHIANSANSLVANAFDPNSVFGPPPTLTFHLNSVYVDNTGLYVAGRNLPALLRIARGLSVAARLPLGTHNARPFRGGVLFNDTDADRLVYFSSTRRVEIAVPCYDEASLVNTGVDDTRLARQAFGRGLCAIDDNLLAAGSSPTTVSVYNLDEGRRVCLVNISMDVRNAAHGIAVWPF